MDREKKECFWNEEKAVAAVEKFVGENGRFPVTAEMNPENGLPSYGTFKTKVGISIFEYGKQFHAELIEPDRQRCFGFWNKEKAVATVEQFVKKNSRFPFYSEMNQENGLPSYGTFKTKVGISIFEYGKQFHAELIEPDRQRCFGLWNKEKAVATVEQFVKKNSRFPFYSEMNQKNGLPAYQTFEKKVGISIFEYRKQNHPELMKERKAKRPNIWNREKATAAVEQFMEKHGRFPLSKEMNQKNGLPSYCTFKTKVGISVFEYGKKSHPEFVNQNGLRYNRTQEWTKEMLIIALERFVEQYNRLPKREEYGSINNLPAYKTFLKITRTAFNDHLNEYFFGHLSQSSEPEEGEIEDIEQDEPSMGMTMSL